MLVFIFIYIEYCHNLYSRPHSSHVYLHGVKLLSVYLQELEEAEFIPMPETPSSASIEMLKDIEGSHPQHTEASLPSTMSQSTEEVLQVRGRPYVGCSSSDLHATYAILLLAFRSSKTPNVRVVLCRRKYKDYRLLCQPVLVSRRICARRTHG